eukprot:gnl/TRDRNA2_/TRDRNA2_31455_c0_seq1.p1 gnl/TRDRNA2_/TRDRNA2_31455_c0~~gnl/TRDRNA2_/TRDRNA2_31455_c0_seq1.p1  ORF type:complete len:419 (+),score=81.76 gnl/TRDRNA2_/TRDRNA2_31455_c0_seq1:114-1370(+)
MSRFEVRSRYTEDVLEHGHTAVYGSYYCIASHRWGYACCLLCERDAECGGSAPLALDDEDPGVAAGMARDPPAPAATSSMAATAPEPRDAEVALAAKVKAEVERILAAPATRPYLVLGLGPRAEGYAVRSAFRRIALLVHPDKNPGYEASCKQALVKAQEAREAVESGKHRERSPTPPDGGDAEARSRKRPRSDKGPPSREAARPAATGPGTVGAEPESRAKFDSTEAFVTYALQFLLDEWQGYVHLSLTGNARTPGRQDPAAVRAAAAAAARDSGAEGVLRSEAALKQTMMSVKSLRKLLVRQALGHEVLVKIDKMCTDLLVREYAAANQAYMDLAIGNKAWHLAVPSLIEGGCGGCTGVQRGQLAKQARTAQRLNSSGATSVMDDEEVRTHVVALRRLLTVAQAIRPNSDPSKSAG